MQLCGFVVSLQWLRGDGVNHVALCKKLLDVDTEDFYCLDCLAEYLECTVSDLEIKIEEFKEQGCTLFL